MGKRSFQRRLKHLFKYITILLDGHGLDGCVRYQEEQLTELRKEKNHIQERLRALKTASLFRDELLKIITQLDGVSYHECGACLKNYKEVLSAFSHFVNRDKDYFTPEHQEVYLLFIEKHEAILIKLLKIVELYEEETEIPDPQHLIFKDI